MRRETLLDFFEDFSTLDDVFLVHDDGYRVRQATYREVATAARAFAGRLRDAGIGTGEPARDKVVIWSENRTEWVIALWGCLLARAVLVPVDFRASPDLLARIVSIVEAKAVLVGAEVSVPTTLTAPVWKLEDLAHDAPAPAPAHDASPSRTRTQEPWNRGTQEPQISGSSLAEIIFTSGATADPKGVTITHKNLLANIIPIEREIRKYRRYERPFHPVRFLNLLPLSHMFGQSMATFVPPMLGGTVVFSHGYNPAEIVRQIKTRRISVLVSVPKVLDVLREHLQRVHPITAEADVLEGKRFFWRWWRYRDVHRMFGWKFWCCISGAAPLDPDLEAFWRKLGFLVVQGYGLTETAPIVTLNHPFRASKGSVGTPIGGVEVKIAPDGEILVRGDNVTSGYYHAGTGGTDVADTTAAFQDGWFHTGDIGEQDAAGRLMIKGRKKEMIVTPQGLNVFPEDVERALAVQPGIRDAAVVGLRVEGEERIHAVLLVAPGADAGAAVRAANATLEDHQRVWSTSIWPGESLPRTEGTQKLKRREIQRWASGEAVPATARAGAGASITDIVSRFAGGREITMEMTLEELGLSSLDRVELMMALEEAFQTTLDEGDLVGTRRVGELQALCGSSVPGSAVPGSGSASEALQARAEQISFPSWNRTAISWFLRRISLPTWILPLAYVFMQREVRGLEHLRGLAGPVIFASNHTSHMDTPAVFLSLPARWRYRTAVAMAKEFFRAHFFPREVTRFQWFTNSLNYYLSAQFFNTFPLPQREAGTRQSLRYVGEVLADGYSVLIFPEGKRSDDGSVLPFRPGIGMMAARLDVPIVPVRLEGLDKVLHPNMRWPKRGPVKVTFGAPMRLTGEDYAVLAKQVEERVRALGG